MDYSDLLPNNKAWATRVPYTNKEEQLKLYTNCTALENGWVWNIPSWERIGTGYVYSDKYTTDLDALEEFKNHLKEKGFDCSKSKFNNISMKVGRRDEMFKKNVCAIGLSAGFIEPLESNGLLSVHVFLMNLVDVLERNNNIISQIDKDAYNKKCGLFFDKFTDFVASHYAYSKREDTHYWKDISNKSFLKLAKSDSIEKDISVRYDIGSNGHMFFNSDYGEHYIYTGMNFYSLTKKNMRTYENINEIKKQNEYRDDLVNKWNNVAKMQPTHLQYLKDKIYNG